MDTEREKTLILRQLDEEDEKTYGGIVSDINKRKIINWKERSKNGAD